MGVVVSKTSHLRLPVGTPVGTWVEPPPPPQAVSHPTMATMHRCCAARRTTRVSVQGLRELTSIADTGLYDVMPERRSLRIGRALNFLRRLPGDNVRLIKPKSPMDINLCQTNK